MKGAKMKLKANQTKTLSVIDNEGNLIEERDVEILYGRKSTYYKKGEFFLMNKTFTKFLKTKRYNNLTFRLLFELLDRIEFNNRISTFRQLKLAEDLDTDQANVSRSLKTLIDDKIIEKREDDYYFTDIFVKFAFDERGKKA